MANTILITGIGGNVGQGILRNIKAVYPNIELIGTNTIGFSAGNHLCDCVYTVPFAYDEKYIETIIELVNKHQVNLIIPSTDYEVYYLSLNKDKFSIPVLASHHLASEMFLDKYLTSIEFEKYKIPFAKTILPSEFESKKFINNIAKPRKGRGSRGIVINPTDVNHLSDNEYLIQELAIGKEITTAFYITKTNELLGLITMERSLENGTTQFCKVVSEYDNKLLPIIEAIKSNFKIVGSINIQCIVTTDNNIVPFEINARISGTNSIRSNFGFNDVIFGVDEWLFNKTLVKPTIKKGMAVRVLMDVIYLDTETTDEVNASTSHFIF